VWWRKEACSPGVGISHIVARRLVGGFSGSIAIFAGMAHHRKWTPAVYVLTGSLRTEDALSPVKASASQSQHRLNAVRGSFICFCFSIGISTPSALSSGMGEGLRPVSPTTSSGRIAEPAPLLWQTGTDPRSPVGKVGAAAPGQAQCNLDLATP